jgi:hypothetical protein
MGGHEMKTNMINKMLKVTLLVAIFATIQVPAISAQETTTESKFVYSSGAIMEVGDSVIINPDSLYYLTGQRMDKWVYGVPHQIRQLGTKRRPSGVLLRGIYSWISQGSLTPLNVKKTQEYADAQQQAAEEADRLAAEEAARLAAEADRLAAEEAARLAAEEAARLAAEEAARLAAESVVAPEPEKIQVNCFTIGVRGGLASLMSKSYNDVMGTSWGLGAMLDLQYAHYWAKAEDKVKVGILTGVGLGYVQNKQTVRDLNEHWSVNGEDGILNGSYLPGTGAIDYSVTMDKVSTTNRQLQVEVPLMFSMVTPKGFFLNVGPKFIVPVYTPYQQTISDTHITATLTGVSTEANKVQFVDDVIFGRLDDFTHKGMNNHQFDLTIAVGGEFGYEHQLQSGHSVSVGLYANYGVYSTYKHDATNANVVSIVPPTASGVAQVTANSVNNAYMTKLGYLDAGLKVAFHLNWKK